MSQRLQIVDSGRAQPPAAMGAILYSTLGNKKICVLGGVLPPRPPALRTHIQIYIAPKIAKTNPRRSAKGIPEYYSGDTGKLHVQNNAFRENVYDTKGFAVSQ